MEMLHVLLLLVFPLADLRVLDEVSIPRSRDCVDPPVSGPLSDAECYRCFEDKCRCVGDKADCSANRGNLTYVPRLPGEIKLLNFSGNNLRAIEDAEFFKNVSSINLLDLSDNQLVNVSEWAFILLTSLTQLSLDNNDHLLYTVTLPAVSNITTLERLEIITVGWEGFEPNDLFEPFKMPNLKRLHFNANTAGHLNLEIFQAFPKLDYLSINFTSKADDQWIQMSSVGSNSLNITKLDLSLVESSDWLPSGCNIGAMQTPFFPRLQYLDVSNRQLLSYSPGSRVCLPNLRVIVSVNSEAYFFDSGLVSSESFPALEALYLDSTKIIPRNVSSANCDPHDTQCLIFENRFAEARKVPQTYLPPFLRKFAFANPSLQTLSLKYSNISFGEGFTEVEVFGDCPNMTNLHLTGNDFSDVNHERFVQIFGTLTNLRHLDLDCTHLTADAFNDSLYVLESLENFSLADNYLTEIPDGFVDNLTNLIHLDLHNNHISLVTETTFSEATRNRLRHLDMSGNPFLCSCDLRWFRDWLRSNATLFNDSRGNYTCSDIPDTLVVDYEVDSQYCLSLYRSSTIATTTTRKETAGLTSVEIIIVAFSVAAGVFVVTVLAVLGFHYRTRIGLLLRRIQLACRRRRRYGVQLQNHNRELRHQRLQEQQFQYDIFVSYASENEDWVRRHLMPELEERQGLRLCVHERDFIPGKNIVDNIENCVETSKKVMMIFSVDFAQSAMCQFELNLCLRHVMDYQDGLVVVLLHAIPPEDLTPSMKAVLFTTTYIEWQEEDFARPAFWNRLRTAMLDIMAEVQV